MTPEQKEAVLTLREGLAFHDYFDPCPDSAQVYVSESGGVLYELASIEGARVLRLGHLRQLLSLLEGVAP